MCPKSASNLDSIRYKIDTMVVHSALTVGRNSSPTYAEFRMLFVSRLICCDSSQNLKYFGNLKI